MPSWLVPAFAAQLTAASQDSQHRSQQAGRQHSSQQAGRQTQAAAQLTAA